MVMLHYLFQKGLKVNTTTYIEHELESRNMTILSDKNGSVK